MIFKGIIGNTKTKEILETALKNKNILHSYLFHGEEGIGKYLIAREFAKGILCENYKDEPCENCKSCIEFNTNNHPDFLTINPDGNNIKIEQIRYMNSKILEKPVISKRKVYIINDSDKMTKEAQNSLLKTLEEPPEYAVIILICSQESNLLTTIGSRCTKIEFNSLNKEEIRKYFGSIGQNVSDEIIELADGSISKAIKRIPKQEKYKKLEELIEQIESIDKLDILKQEFIYEEKDDIWDLLEAMNNIIFKKAKEEGKLKYLNCVKIIESTKERLKANSNFDMCIDNLLLGIWEEINETNCRS